MRLDSINNVNVTTWKMIFGFLTLLVVAGLAAIIALGKVEEHTSYGLPYLLGGLTSMCGGFSTWAFGSVAEKKEPPAPSVEEN